MKQKNSNTIMKCVGSTLAICSALAFVGGTKKMKSSCAKKTMEKAASKVIDIVDSVSSFM